MPIFWTLSLGAIDSYRIQMAYTHLFKIWCTLVCSGFWQSSTWTLYYIFHKYSIWALKIMHSKNIIPCIYKKSKPIPNLSLRVECFLKFIEQEKKTQDWYFDWYFDILCFALSAFSLSEASNQDLTIKKIYD